MIKCSHCGKLNPEDARYCLKCGNFLSATKDSKQVTKISWTKRIPVLGWILIGVAALFLLLLFITTAFWAVASISGIASIIFLVIGFFVFGVYRKGNFIENKKARAIFIGFFALMGATIDQTGNQLYNAPIEKIECPAATFLNRTVNVDHPYAGNTIVTQDYTCYDNKGSAAKKINMFAVMGYRFAEYIILAYLLIGLRWLINAFRTRNMKA